MGPTDRFLLGTDLAKDRATLEAAYDDAQGVTAAFNRNLLRPDQPRTRRPTSTPDASPTRPAIAPTSAGSRCIWSAARADRPHPRRGPRRPLRRRASRSTPRTRTSTRSTRSPAWPSVPGSSRRRPGPTRTAGSASSGGGPVGRVQPARSQSPAASEGSCQDPRSASGLVTSRSHRQRDAQGRRDQVVHQAFEHLVGELARDGRPAAGRLVEGDAGELQGARLGRGGPRSTSAGRLGAWAPGSAARPRRRRRRPRGRTRGSIR